LLTGRYLERWIAGESLVPAWLERVGLVGLALVGVVVSVGLLVLGGLIPLTALQARRTIPGVRTLGRALDSFFAGSRGGSMVFWIADGVMER
jgi:hypothetical protein